MRLFTGISIPERVLANLENAMLKLRALAPLNWSPIENLHITSKFIGHWPGQRLPELQEALAQLEPPPPFIIMIAGFGYLPNPNRPSVLFAGVEVGPELAELANRIESAVEPLGVARENRTYSPHLTLARIKPQTPPGSLRQLREHIAGMGNLDFGTFEATAFHLYLSKPGPRGSIYTSLACYPLPAASGSES